MTRSLASTSDGAEQSRSRPLAALDRDEAVHATIVWGPAARVWRTFEVLADDVSRNMCGALSGDLTALSPSLASCVGNHLTRLVDVSQPD